MDKNQKQAFSILGGLAAILFVAKKMNRFPGSFNDEEENQYQKALRLMRQARQANKQRTDIIDSEDLKVKTMKGILDNAIGYPTGHIPSVDDRNNNTYSNWRAQNMYWDNVDTSGKRKKHMDTTWHTEDDE